MKKLTYLIIILIFISIDSIAGGFIIVSPPGSSTWVGRGVNPYSIEVRSMKVTVDIHDQLAKTTVEEVFYNPSSQNLQGWFLFPVPKGAVIKDFTMEINGKQMPAELLDANKARKIYEDIVRQTLDPALLEYSNQQLFKVRIFPIEAQKEKKIVISYTEVLEKDNSTCEYIFPLNTNKYSAKPLNEVSILVDAKTTAKLKTIYCPTHEVETIRKSDYKAKIGYEAKTIKPDKDYKLYLSTDNSKLGASILTHNSPAESTGFFFLNITPGFALDKNEIVNKDITFVLDVSGSMSGEKLDQAKKSLLFCVNNLNKGDKFEIVRFSTEAKALFGKRVEYDKSNLAKAREFINNLRAIGGTNIDEAFQIACDEKADPDRPHMIVFITDGKPTIGETNEEKLLGNVKKHNSDNLRVFTFGIGDDINTHLLDKITAETKAFRSYISPDEDIEVKVSNFYTKVSSPVLTDIKISYSNGLDVSEVYPRQMPDLFKGSSITLLGRFKRSGNGTITVTGKVNGKDEKFTYKVDFKTNDHNEFIPQLWASRKIGFLLDQIRLNGENKELVDEVTTLAKQYGIITPYTSYLILEDEAVNVANNNIRRDRVIFNNRFAEGTEEDFVKRNETEFKQSKTRSGRGSVVSSSEFQSLGNAEKIADVKQGQSRMMYKDKTGKTKNFANQVRNIQGRAIYQNGNEWVDLYVQQKKTKKVNKIKFASKDYFKLLDSDPETSEFLALGKNVKFVYNNEMYEVYE